MPQTSIPTAHGDETNLESGSAPESNTTSVEASPAPGLRAPPSTPVSQAVTSDKVTLLDPIEEDENDWLNGPPRDLPHQGNNAMAAISVASPATDTPTKSGLGPDAGNLTPTQHKLLFRPHPSADDKVKQTKLAELERRAHGYMDNVIENFRKSKATMFEEAQAKAEAKAQKHLNEAIANHSAARTSDLDPASLHVSPQLTLCTLVIQIGAASDISDESSIIPFPDFVDSSVSTGGMKLSTEDKIVQHDETSPFAGENGPSANLPSASETVAKGNLDDHKVHLTPTMTDTGSVPFTLANSPTIVVTASTDTDKSVKSEENGSAQEENTEEDGEDGQEEESDDDREHRTHFKTWGTPVLRNKQSK